jgi:hypothetical protein
MKKVFKKCREALVHKGFESRYMEGSYSAKAGLVCRTKIENDQ